MKIEDEKIILGAVYRLWKYQHLCLGNMTLCIDNEEELAQCEHWWNLLNDAMKRVYG